MKKAILLFAIVLGFTAFSFAQSKPAEFKFEKETHDFGKVVSGKSATFEFKFTNVGDEPLIIKGTEATCGCTVPKYTTTPIKKGESGSIQVTYSASGAAMRFNKAVTISSNASTPVKVLYIKGEVVDAGK